MTVRNGSVRMTAHAELGQIQLWIRDKKTRKWCIVIVYCPYGTSPGRVIDMGRNPSCCFHADSKNLRLLPEEWVK